MHNSIIICTTYPLPENIGGNMRTMNYVRALSTLGRVDIAYTNNSEHAKTDERIFSKKYYLDRETYPTDTLKRLYYALQGIPFPINIFRGQEKTQIVELINSGYYENVLIRYMQNTSIVKEIKEAHKRKVIVDVDDMVTASLYETLFYETTSRIKSYKRLINKILLNKYYEKIIRRFRTVFCSESDRALYARKGSSAFVVPNIYENDEMVKQRFRHGHNNGHVLLFVGTLNYYPNVRGLKWFVETIYAQYSATYNGAKLLVVGRAPLDEVKNICSGYAGIELHADADSIIPYYEAAKAIVVPILEGGGTRIKILEAGMTNRPVLSTPMGAYGLDLEEGKDILFFENVEEFMTKYKKLLNREYYNMVSDNMKNIVMRKYSRKSFDNAFYSILRTS